ncbi:MAG: hypothetical protein IT534_05495 [Bauldia sp.]|nr:hypothetical protein [Bauldia sp.]
MLSTTLASAAFAQEVCPALQAQLDEISHRYEGDFQQIQADGTALGANYDRPNAVEGMVGINFTVEWVDHRWIFDLPTVNMREQTWKFDLPEITWDDTEIIFHTPSVRMETTICGYYPEWHGLFDMRWSPIYCDLPQVFMEEQRFVLGLPQFAMREQQIILHVPEFEMARQEWVISIPEFRATEVNAEVRAIQAQGEALQARGTELGDAMKAEFAAAIGASFDCQEEQLELNRTVAIPQMEGGVSALQTTIQTLVDRGGDPTNVNGRNLVTELETLVAQRDRAIAALDAALAQLRDARAQALAGVAA